MSELIDREALLDECLNHYEVGNIEQNCTMDWICKTVRNFPAASPWHRVDEELPEETKVVIIHKKWDDEITLGYSYSFGEIRLWMCLKTPYDIYEVPWVGAGHVDYWMPLPEPPKEEE